MNNTNNNMRIFILYIKLNFNYIASDNMLNVTSKKKAKIDIFSL